MPFVSKALDSRLEEVVKATFRVERGSGTLIQHNGTKLLVTAAHVLPQQEKRACINLPTGVRSLDVLACDRQNDIAVIADHPDIKNEGLTLVADSLEIGLGDEVWIGGFPIGWDGSTPVFSKGIVAAVGSEIWLNIDANWGQSGGPVFQITDDGPRVVGIVLGHGGRASLQLENLSTKLRQACHELEQLAQNSGNAILAGISMKAFAHFTATTFGELANLVDAHFRSGNVRIAAAASIRRHLS